jgi:hypothetical protein
LEAPVLTPYRAPKGKEISPLMASGYIQDSLNKDSTEEVYDKTSGILTIIQIHADQGCIHCIDLIKNGIGNQPIPDADEHPKVQLRNVQQ